MAVGPFSAITLMAVSSPSVSDAWELVSVSDAAEASALSSEQQFPSGFRSVLQMCIRDRALSGVLGENVAENLAHIMDTVTSVLDTEADCRLVFDPTLVRGMGYYTGTIFEVSVEGLGYSVAGGGRYDLSLIHI